MSCEIDESYEPYGEQWEKELLKNDKKFIVKLCGKALRKKMNENKLLRQELINTLRKESLRLKILNDTIKVLQEKLRTHK